MPVRVCKCEQHCCSAAAGIAVLMHQQHRVHLASAAIIDDLRGVMSHQILPLTNQDDHYLYSLIFASTALRKSESTPHVTWPSLQLPGSSLSYELAPAHAVVCCCVLAFMAFWLAPTWYLDLWTVESARRKAKHSYHLLLHTLGFFVRRPRQRALRTAAVLKLSQVPNNADESRGRPNPLPRCNGLPIKRDAYCK